MRINVTLNDGTYIYSENPSKRKMSSLNSKLQGKVGTCRVDYDIRGFYNEFEFDGDFEYKIGPCIEDELVNQYRKG